ncbi:protein alcS [Aspergillus desertorum]
MKMTTDISNGEAKGHHLSTIHSSITLSAEQFEKLYLSPTLRQQPSLAKKVGNPTPLALGGFVITTTPLSCCLMAWRGSSGNGIAFIGPIIFLGGLLLLITSILQFILGNTFPCVVFGTIGGFWFAFAATMIPSFNAAGLYEYIRYTTQPALPSPLTCTLTSLIPLAFLFITMAVLMLIFLLCATRTNFVYTLIFLTLLLVFLLLSAGYWRLGEGDAVVGDRCIKSAGASPFVASLLGFYLLVAQLFDAVGPPITLPVGDMERFWTRSQK